MFLGHTVVLQRTDKLSGVATLCGPVLATVRTECLVLQYSADIDADVFRFSLSFSNYYCTPNHQCTYLWTGSSFHIFHGLSQFSLLLRCTKNQRKFTALPHTHLLDLWVASIRFNGKASEGKLLDGGMRS